MVFYIKHHTVYKLQLEKWNTEKHGSNIDFSTKTKPVLPHEHSILDIFLRKMANKM